MGTTLGCRSGAGATGVPGHPREICTPAVIRALMGAGVQISREVSQEPARSAPSAARPASRRATGTRNGEQDT